MTTVKCYLVFQVALASRRLCSLSRIACPVKTGASLLTPLQSVCTRQESKTRGLLQLPAMVFAVVLSHLLTSWLFAVRLPNCSSIPSALLPITGKKTALHTRLGMHLNHEMS